jgi:hypothetical protein
MLREAFSRISGSRGFRMMSYALSVLAISLAIMEATGIVAGIDLLPSWSGALLALSVVFVGFSYSFFGGQTKGREKTVRRPPTINQ